MLWKPEHFARHYYEQGADELIYMDAVVVVVKDVKPGAVVVGVPARPIR